MQIIRYSVLDSNNVPKITNIKEIILELLAHREVIILRRSKFYLSNLLLIGLILERLNQLHGTKFFLP